SKTACGAAIWPSSKSPTRSSPSPALFDRCWIGPKTPGLLWGTPPPRSRIRAPACGWSPFPRFRSRGLEEAAEGPRTGLPARITEASVVTEDREERLLRLAEAIADGRQVNWQKAVQDDPDSSDRIEALRVLQTVGDAHTPPPTQIPATWGSLT